MAQKVAWILWLSQVFQKERLILALTQRGKAHWLITNRPGKNGIAGIIGNKLIDFGDL